MASKFNINTMTQYAEENMCLFGVDTKEYWFFFEVENLAKEINTLLQVSLMMEDIGKEKEADVVTDKAVAIANKAAEAENADEICVLHNEAYSLVDLLLKLYA